MAATARINRGTLKQARQRVDLTHIAAARNVTSDPERLRDWEEGDTFPSFAQAKKLAKKFRVPFGYLFLTNLPDMAPDIPDLRTVGDRQPDPLSVDFADTLNLVRRKQNWYRDFMIGQQQPAASVVSRFDSPVNFQVVADDIRAELDLSPNLRRVGGRDVYLSALVTKAESAGVLVMRSGIVGNNTRRGLSVEEFRGFALIDQYAPVVFINSKDAKAAQIFTLLHELAHIWIGQSGVSNFDPSEGEHDGEVEVLCNRIAVEALVPQVEYRRFWNLQLRIADNITNLSGRFKVSGIAILRRAFELQLISRREFFDELPNQHYDGPRAQGTGGDPYNTIPARNSKKLTGVLLRSMQEGGTLYRDAANLLGVKVSTAVNLSQRLRDGG